MAEEFDPAWEYYVGDPEVEEFLAEQAAGGSPLWSMYDLRGAGPWRRARDANLGYLFHKPGQQPFTYLGRERVVVVRESRCRTRVACAWCRGEFAESRPLMGLCCSTYCAGQYRGARRRVRAQSAVCPGCREAFEPVRVGQRYCSRQCGGRVVMKSEYETGCPVCGGDVEPQEVRRGPPKRFCSRRCGTIMRKRVHQRAGTFPAGIEEVDYECGKPDVAGSLLSGGQEGAVRETAAAHGAG